MKPEGSGAKGKISRFILIPVARKFIFRVSAKMLANKFIAFTVPFVTVGALGLLIQLIPWIFRTGVTDIDPLPILLFAFLSGFLSMYLRYQIMKRFSGIRP